MRDETALPSPSEEGSQGSRNRLSGFAAFARVSYSCRPSPTEPTQNEHDRLFKELLGTFFAEFIELFFPKLAQHLDPEVGLIHVENQATAQSDFPRRMFEYFARLTLKFKIPVYPIVLFSCDAPRRAEPTAYRITFPDTQVLRFQYRVVQLNRLPWRRFLKSDNPARTRLLGVFIDPYLRLTAAEMTVFEREMAGSAPAERQETMEMVSSWELKGREEGLDEGKRMGLHEGKQEVAMRLIRKRLGLVSEDIEARVAELSSEQLSELSEALLDFTNRADLEAWLARR